MVTSNQIQKTFFIEANHHFGTGFTLYDIDGNEYLITAKHVVNFMDSGGNIRIIRDNQWMNLQVSIFLHSNPSIDIAVLKATSRIISNPLPITYSMDSITYGQDVFFLGFPYGIISSIGSNINSGFPLPFIKKAICSSIAKIKDVSIIYLDGQNNPGFSGGPVCFQNRNTNTYNIGAVISGYMPNIPKNILDQEGKDSGLRYQENSGIIICHDINHAFEILSSIIS